MLKLETFLPSFASIEIPIKLTIQGFFFDGFHHFLSTPELPSKFLSMTQALRLTTFLPNLRYQEIFSPRGF